MKKRLICTMGILACGSAAFAVTFTGDVVADFAAADVTVLDLHNDVGLPNNAPAGTISGWDLSSVQFLLDAAADELNIGLDFRSFAGDADGDGLDGITSLWLATNGGIDMGGMAQTEAICIAFDFDQDGDYEIIAGYGAVDNVYRVSYFTGSPLLPAFGFGGLAPHDGGHAWGPDLEIALSDISTLDTLDPLCFDFLMFAGSYQDDGIGEDLLAGEACWPPVQATDPVRLDLLKAQPNP
ncbi:MAG: hypothetical protein FJ170_05005, partial [Gammaproteobacteria bacterium]|nr:hypothetical protein [Gammaproteobacteria bacterium]